MQRVNKIGKLPLFCEGPESLQAGDILIFNYNPESRRLDSGGFMTVHNQGYMNESGGHRTSVHAGFIVQTDEGLRLAHVLGSGFLLDELDCKFLKRTVHIYRPRKFQHEIAEQLNELVAEHLNDQKPTEEIDDVNSLLLEAPERRVDKVRRIAKKFKWDTTVAIRALVHRIFTSLMLKNRNPLKLEVDNDVKFPDNVISEQTICSKYVADSYISACHRMTNSSRPQQGDHHQVPNFRAFLMNISSLTPPKALQAYLYRNSNYGYLVMPHTRHELYAGLRAKIFIEIERLKHEVLIAARLKGAALQRALDEFEASEPDADMMKRCIALLKVLSPILKHNTGNHLVTPTSYRNVIAFAKNEGIYPEYLDYDLHDRHEGKIKTLAQKYYNFNPALAKLYQKSSQIGLSDEEAKFECKPTFGDWFKLSPARNIALTCTVIGFFAWVLPHGLSRVKSTEARNKKYLADAAAPVMKV